MPPPFKGRNWLGVTPETDNPQSGNSDDLSSPKLARVQLLEYWFGPPDPGSDVAARRRPRRTEPHCLVIYAGMARWCSRSSRLLGASRSSEPWPQPLTPKTRCTANGTFALNQGCGEGPRGHIHVNESKNENGGCIADQFWTINFGYIVPVEECGGRVDIYELTHKEESFPRCWNRTNANDLIHCRYNTW